MKRYKYAKPLTVILLATSTLCLAETQPQKAPMGDMNMAPGKSMMHQGMNMGAMGMSEEQRNEHLRAYQEHLLKMHDLSNQILAEKDPAKKEQLKSEQLELMKAHHDQMMQHRMQMMQHQKNMQPDSKQ